MEQKTKKIIPVAVISAILIGFFTFIKIDGLQGKTSLDSNINRAVFSKILAESLSNAKGEDINSMVSDADCNIFSDVKMTDWYGPYVCYLYLNEILAAKETFQPSKELTKAEGVKLIMSVYQIVKYPNNDNINAYTKTEQAYRDVTVNTWYYTWIQGAASLGITDVKPFSNLQFYPNQALTNGRAQLMVKNLNKLLN